MRGYIEIATLLIDEGAEVNKKDGAGKTPLHYAVEKGNIESVESLVKNGAYANEKYKNEKSLLSLIFEYYDNLNRKEKERLKSIATYLIAKGTKVNVKDRYGRSLLHYAVWKEDIKTVEILLRNNANINAESGLGNTPLHGFSIKSHTYNKKESVKIATYLIDHYANVNARNK